MKYIIKTIHNDKIYISDEEYKKLLQAKTDIVVLKNGISIRKNIIALIYPEGESKKIEDRARQTNGVLHDGTRVIKRFGEWVVANDSEVDESGDFQPIRLDREHYPEVAANCVASQEEWQKVLDGGKYYEIVGCASKEERRLNSGFESIGELIEKNNE